MRSLLSRALVAAIVVSGCAAAAAPHADAARAARSGAAAKTCYDIWIFLLTPGQPITICL
jgi:hypothetical protein